MTKVTAEATNVDDRSSGLATEVRMLGSTRKIVTPLRSREDSASGADADSAPALERLPKLEHFACAVAEELLSEVRDELKNRLGAIGNATRYLEKKVGSDESLASDPRVSTFLAVILQEIEASRGLLESGTSLARLPAAQTRQVSLAEALMSALARVEMGDGVQLIWKRRAEPEVRIVPEQLHLVLECLLHAALEALANGGRLELTVNEEDGAALLEMVVSGADLAGFDRTRTLERLSHPREGRFPLGLDVVKRAAERHGGGLEQAEDPDRERVVLHLPCADE